MIETLNKGRTVFSLPFDSSEYTKTDASLIPLEYIASVTVQNVTSTEL